MSRRQYSDREKAEALAALDANGGDSERTAQQLGIPGSNLRAWAQGRGVHAEVAQQCTEKKADLADELEKLAYKCVELLPGKLASASAQQIATALGITVDKMQLLRRQPTTITETQDLNEDERARRIAALLDRARGRQSVALPDADGAGGDRATPSVN